MNPLGLNQTICKLNPSEIESYRNVSLRNQILLRIKSFGNRPLRVANLRDWPPGAAFNKNLHQEGVAKNFFSLHKKCF